MQQWQHAVQLSDTWWYAALLLLLPCWCLHAAAAAAVQCQRVVPKVQQL
jgi:hypothetical protein